MTNNHENTEEETVCGVKPVSQHAQKHLNPRQIEDYRSHRTQLIRWMDQVGKNPEQAEGYATETVQQRAYRLDKFYRYVWTELEDGYTTRITTDHGSLEPMSHAPWLPLSTIAVQLNSTSSGRSTARQS